MTIKNDIQYLMLSLKLAIKPIILFVLSYLAYIALIMAASLLTSTSTQHIVQDILGYLLACSAFISIYWLLMRWINLGFNTIEKSHYVLIQKHFGFFIFLKKWAKVLLALIMTKIAIEVLYLPKEYEEIAFKLLTVGSIIAVAVFICRLTMAAFDNFIANRAQDVQAKKISIKTITQLTTLKKAIIAIIIIITTACVFLQFDSIREIGTSILASAGIIGVVVGIAERQALSGVFTAIQVMFTQPIRINDTVVYNGEFGNVEEITLTHVTIKAWDLRRIIVPIGHFLEKPFENWTLKETNLIGTVFIYVDYGMPINFIRDELKAILDKSNLWDRQTSAVHVTNLSHNSIEIRILVSAANAGKLWDLRCYVREQLMNAITTRYPQYLPKIRNETYSANKPEDYLKK